MLSTQALLRALDALSAITGRPACGVIVARGGARYAVVIDGPERYVVYAFPAGELAGHGRTIEAAIEDLEQRLEIEALDARAPR